MRRIAVVLALLVLLTSAVFVGAQANPPPETESGLQLTVSHQSCGMVYASEAAATPEATIDASAATPESVSASDVSLEATAEATDAIDAFVANYPRIVMGSDCYLVTPYLTVASNDVLWVGLALPNEPQWQTFEVIPQDDSAPKLDKRGRFVGCTGVTTCRFLWDNLGTTYLIEIPMVVKSAYIAPITAQAQSVVSTPPPTVISTPNPLGIWGSCGSCSTCGGPVEQCVLSPDNVCMWDAATCEHPKHSG